MNEKEFTKLITSENLSKYKNLSKNFCRKVYKIENNNKNYILKINTSKTLEEFELITKIILILNDNKFSTPKLLFSKYQNKTSYFLFEYILEIGEGRGERGDEDIEKILKLLLKYYKLTSKNLNEKKENEIIKYLENNIDKFSFIHKNLLQNIISELKEDKNQILIAILTDVNPTNFIQVKNKVYLIDFDEVCFSEIEFDIAQIFLNFIINVKTKNTLEQNLLELKKIILNFETIQKINSSKIINYLIISMYQDIFKYEQNKEIQEEIFKKILFILNNKKTILSML